MSHGEEYVWREVRNYKKDKKSTKDIMQMLDLNETIDQLARANCVRWHGHVLRKD